MQILLAFPRFPFMLTVHYISISAHFPADQLNIRKVIKRKHLNASHDEIINVDRWKCIGSTCWYGILFIIHIDSSCINRNVMSMIYVN